MAQWRSPAATWCPHTHPSNLPPAPRQSRCLLLVPLTGPVVSSHVSAAFPTFQADPPHCHLPMILSAFSDHGGGAEQHHRVPGLSDTGSQQRGQRYILNSSFNHFCSMGFVFLSFQTACRAVLLSIVLWLVNFLCFQMCCGLLESSQTLTPVCSQLCTVTTRRCVKVRPLLPRAFLLLNILPFSTIVALQPVWWGQSEVGARCASWRVNDGVGLRLLGGGCRTRRLLRRQEPRGRKSSWRGRPLTTVAMEISTSGWR